ncbi:hypothetical protein M3Y98_00937500 [Aphelenchoides besseyi]|nr:hypothetical protein M3Y98_00937500 [Aphelenchoides besseyi]KAI6194302.1 hypothetical protein M3Y96_01110600 [Aphelenchoides besseyi]
MSGTTAITLLNARIFHLGLLVFLVFLFLCTNIEARSLYNVDSQLQDATVMQNFQVKDARSMFPESQSEQAFQIPQKRRVVIRVPFAQNPDSIQLNRIYKLYTQQKEKKELGPSTFERALRGWLQ